VIPTSFLPIITLVIFTGIIWSESLAAWIDIPWLAYPLGFLLGPVSLYLVFAALDRLMTAKLRQRICPRCGGELEGVGGGFIDGGRPGAVELLTYALSLLAALGGHLLSGAPGW
jgi:hypothetical protein